jgi:hypothetical protein
MESASRINYNSAPATDAESEVAVTVKHTLNEGLNDSSLIAFRIPADGERFTDLSTAILSVQYKILKNDGTPVDEESKIMLDSGGMHSMFTSCTVYFNEQPVSTINSYAHTASLCQYLGMDKEVRESLWDEVDGSWRKSQLKRSNVLDANENKFVEPINRSSQGSVTLYGRLLVDIFQSCRQLLPPGVSIGVDLRRAADYFSLLKITAPGDGVSFKLSLQSASLYIRRLKLEPLLHSRALATIKDGGANLQFNKLETRVMTARPGTVYRWLDCLNGAPLPNRLYVGLVLQAGYHGVLDEIGTYFQNFKLKTFQAKLNGRDLLVEPIRCSFKYEADGDIDGDKSDAKSAFLSVAECTGHLTDPTLPLRIAWKDYVLGNNIFAVELGKCGEKSGSSGAIDLEFEFDNNNKDMCIVLFTEKTSDVTVYPKL